MIGIRIQSSNRSRKASSAGVLGCPRTGSLAAASDATGLILPPTRVTSAEPHTVSAGDAENVPGDPGDAPPAGRGAPRRTLARRLPRRRPQGPRPGLARARPLHGPRAGTPRVLPL